MTTQNVYLSTTIPYVNARPHLGHALELVQADVLARHHRQAGDQVRFQTGTDDNSLKNVLAAEAEGLSPAALVGRNAEQNWFFRLSRYAGQLHDLITSGRLRIEPAARRNEVLGFIAGGLEDISVSRSTARARDWGIPVPDDPDQVIYVWFDALGNYITSLGYATGAPDYQRWWAGADRRVHLVGKGVLRFHAVNWPAILLSAGEPLPTEIGVHDYLTIGGSKISKSSPLASAADPVTLAGRYGTDALRWWLLREVPRVGDADFTAARLVARANGDLANDLGNLVSRVVALVHRYRDGRVPVISEDPERSAAPESALIAACRRAPERIAAALATFDFRAATAAILDVVEEANRYVEKTEPWHLARSERAGEPAAGEALDEVLALLIGTCSDLGRQAAPFLPGLAGRIRSACDDSPGQLPPPRPLFPRLDPVGVLPAA